MVPVEMPVAAIDSMITQGIVSKAPIPVTTQIDHQGVSVGQATTETTEMMKPNRKTREYYQAISKAKSEMQDTYKP